MKKFLKFVKTIFKNKNWKKLVPYLAGLLVFILGAFGVQMDPESLNALLLLIGGFIASLIGILDNNDKQQEQGENSNNSNNEKE